MRQHPSADSIRQVIINDYREFSLIAAGAELPDGWRPVGPPATLSSCLDRINELWTDLRAGYIGRGRPLASYPSHPNPDPGLRGNTAGVLSLFDSQCQKAPAATAVMDDEETCSYQQLARLASAVADELRASGVGRGDVVGVARHPSPRLVAEILGVLKAGAAYVAVDPSAPPARTRFIIKDAGAVRVLASADFLAGMRPIDLAAPNGRASHQDSTGQRPEGDPDRLVYIMYTSGSTGTPKGVAMQQGPLLNMLSWEAERIRRRAALHHPAAPTDGRQRVLHFLRPTFDVSFQEIFASLAQGDCLVTVTDQQRHNPEDLLRLIAKHDVQRAYLPVPVLAQLAHVSGELGNTAIPLWDIVVVGGQLRVTPEIRRFVGGLDRAVLDDQYGMTEAHTVLGAILSGPPADWPSDIAFPDTAPQVSISIAEEELPAAGTGDGEICIGGAALSRGYVGAAALTAQRFVPDPAGRRPGSRRYRTGDIGHRLPDGSIRVTGRLDDQIKLRGYRIEPAEIEQALLNIPGVAQAVVLATGHEDSQRLMAFVVPLKHGGLPAVPELRAALAQTLPAHMVPSGIVIVAALPLTAHGKVDRDQLGRWNSPGVNDTGMSSTQEAIGRIWAETLDSWIDSVHADFFACGGTSLSATKVITRIRHHFGLQVAFRSIFDHPILEDLARHVEQAPPIRSQHIQRVPPDQAVPASRSQLGMWFHSQLNDAPTMYNISWAYRVDGELDPEILRRSVDRIVQRHEILRTIFLARDDVLVQRVLGNCGEAPFSVVGADGEDLVSLTSGYQREAFDLATGPLHRTLLVRSTEGTQWLVFVAHHVVMDAWSESLYRNELSELYNAAIFGRECKLPVLRTQYRDYCAWRDRQTTTPTYARQLRYWHTTFAGYKSGLALPPDRAGATETTAQLAYYDFRIDADESAHLRTAASRAAASLFLVLLAAFAQAITDVAGVSEAVVGIPHNGRTRPDFEPLIGMFTNTLPLRVRVGNAKTFHQVLTAVRTAALEAFSNSDADFEDIVRGVLPGRLTKRIPLIDAWFDFEEPFAELNLGRARAHRLDLPRLNSQFDLSMAAWHHGTGIAGRLTYRPSTGMPATTNAILRRFLDYTTEAAACIPGNKR